MDTDGASRTPLGVRHAFTVSKHADRPDENEDRWASSDDGSVCALSDGASVSFDPATWAGILVRRFVQEPHLSREWLGAALHEYESAFDREAMPWMQQAAFDTGSFATLLGIACPPVGEAVRVLAVGDSLLAVADDDRLIRTIPYEHAEAFDQPPLLLSTNRAENGWLDDAPIARSWQEFSLAGIARPILLLMSDALGRWLLDGPAAERLPALLRIEDEPSFARFVEHERAEGRLKRDDTTLIVIEPRV